jgi:hypothetical protein
MAREMHRGEVSEAEADQWVDEAEAGHDVDKLKARIGRPARGAEASQVVPVRLTIEELEALMARAGREHLNRSEARRASAPACSTTRARTTTRSATTASRPTAAS